MSYLLVQIFICLLIAGLIGLLIGWLLRGGCRNKLVENDKYWDEKLNGNDAIWENKIQSLLSEKESEKQNINRQFLMAKDEVKESKKQYQSLELEHNKLFSEQQDLELKLMKKTSSDTLLWKNKFKTLVNENELKQVELTKLEQLLAENQNKLDNKPKQEEQQLLIKKNQHLIQRNKQLEMDFNRKLRSATSAWEEKFNGLKEVEKSRDNEKKELEQQLLIVANKRKALEEQLLKEHKNAKEKEIHLNHEMQVLLVKASESEKHVFTEMEELKRKLKLSEEKVVSYKEEKIISNEEREHLLTSENKIKDLELELEESNKKWEAKVQLLEEQKSIIQNKTLNPERNSHKTRAKGRHVQRKKKSRGRKQHLIESSSSTQKRDNLQLIKGIGKVLEERLNNLEIYSFEEISKWDKEKIKSINTTLSFSGKIEREEWIEQAKKLALGEETEFSERVKKGEVPSSENK